MRIVLRVCFSFLLVVLLVGCIRDGENLENCFRLIRINLEWIDTAPLSETEQVNIAITSSGGQVTRLTSDVVGREVSLLADRYTIVGWEDEENVAINTQDGVVAVLSRDGSLLEPTLFSAGENVVEVEFLPDTLIIPLPMYQQTRPLIIEVEFIDTRSPIINEFPPVKTITATLSGITLERKVNDGFVSVEAREPEPALKRGDITYTMEKTTLRQDETWYVDQHNLLGLDGVSHSLNLYVEFEDGNSGEFTFDVTEELKGFHSEEIHKPWYIIITLELDSSLNVSIQDWIAGPDSWLIAQ